MREKSRYEICLPEIHNSTDKYRESDLAVTDYKSPNLEKKKFVKLYRKLNNNKGDRYLSEINTSRMSIRSDKGLTAK